MNKISTAFFVCSLAALVGSASALAKTHSSEHQVNRTTPGAVARNSSANLAAATSNAGTTNSVNGAAIAQKIENIIHQHGASAHVGIAIQSINSGKIIYQYNARHLLGPASSLKVFTAAAALAHLGPNYTFKTRLFAAPKSINDQGVLQSDVYFHFDGDPTLSRSDLNNLVGILSQLGVNTIQGDLYLDDTVFDRAEFGPGWMWDERNFCYAAPLSAVNIDRNCFPLTLTAAKQSGQPITITKYKGYGFIEFVNEAVTSETSTTDCPLTIDADSDNTYTVNGCMKPHSGPWSFPIAVRSMRPYTAGIFEQLLRQNNIHLNGTIKFGKIPTNKTLEAMVGHDSAPLSTVTKIMLKKSDNLIADALYKKLGAVYFGKAGTWSSGSRATAAIISEGINTTSSERIDFTKIKIVDGCGLSRHNLLSPQSLVSLLNYVYRDLTIRDAFINALPIAGIDGSLQERMVTAKNRVYAKTGTMKGITALAGYIYTNHNQVLSFAILINDFVEPIKTYHQLQDEICTLLATKM